MIKSEEPFCFELKRNAWQFQRSDSIGLEKAEITVQIDEQDFNCFKYSGNEQGIEVNEDISENCTIYKVESLIIDKKIK